MASNWKKNAIPGQKIKTIGHLSVGSSNWKNTNFEHPIQVQASKHALSKNENRFPLKNQVEKLNKIAIESFKIKLNTQ